VTLTRNVSADAFERLVQRLLRESGFVQVKVTGRTGDGGIDGKGMARIHGLMSFHVVFQAKKYQGVVSAGQVCDFRGAMVGRADKGLFITTGSFTKDAIREATRDGAPPIDLVDGDALADKLKEFGLGIGVRMVEEVSVDGDWFRRLYARPSAQVTRTTTIMRFESTHAPLASSWRRVRLDPIPQRLP
jgi:restriction system protein